MKLTNKSKNLLTYFTKNKYIQNNENNENNENNNFIVKQLYYELSEAYKYSKTVKYTVNIKGINNRYNVIKPKGFHYSSFPEKVRYYIDVYSLTEISYIFSLNERKIKVYFVEECSNEQLNMEEYHRYIESIIIWLYILDIHSPKVCSNSLIIYLYFTSLNKNLPTSHIEILDQVHVNTAFTYSCPKDSEIVIFRKEEWFKVFIHETFHSFGLDFSNMNNAICNSTILTIFKVASNVNLYEAYTECWAEIINILFCCFYTIKNKEDICEFLYYFEIFIYLEINYSLFQLVKVLQHMGLTYKNLYLNDSNSNMLRENLYKENTSVLSYYIIKTILLYNYKPFLVWCNTNNISLLQFKKSNKNLISFCDFIQSKYNNKHFLRNIECAKKVFEKVKKQDKFIVCNLRMSIFELG